MNEDVFRMLAADEAVSLVAEPRERQSEDAAEARSLTRVPVADTIRRAPRIMLDSVEMHDVVTGLIDVAGEHHLHASAASGESLDHRVSTGDHRVLRARPFHVGVPASIILEEDNVLVDDRRVWFQTNSLA